MATILKSRLIYPKGLAEQMRVLTRRVEDRESLHEAIGTGMVGLVRGHLLYTAAPTRHTTAQRLGARPTNYLSKLARGVEAVWNKSWASITMPTGDSREIFARVEGPVVIEPRDAKYLAIPAKAVAYGRRPREFSDLVFVQFGSTGVRALIKRGSGGKGKKPDVFFWLKDRVTLPQDEGLLPAEYEFFERMAENTLDWIDYQLLELEE